MGVIYLAWLPFGIQYFKRFIDSYIRFDAACPHQLIIVFNGLSEKYPDEPEKYLAYMQSRSVNPSVVLHFQSGQDIDIYRQAADKIDCEVVLFLNTYSELLATDWLKNYAASFDEKTGVIGGSGSFQSYYSSVYQTHLYRWEANKDFLYNFRKYKLFIKAFIYWRFLFKPFPNAHIRTNAFMVRRKEFLAIRSGGIRSKFQAYQFESGRRGMTAYYKAKGLKTLIIDRFGRTFTESEWKNSATFWIKEQENLLVADNQTTLYRNATKEQKEEMTRLAWGTT
jgi:hypothetical protein